VVKIFSKPDPARIIEGNIYRAVFCVYRGHIVAALIPVQRNGVVLALTSPVNLPVLAGRLSRNEMFNIFVIKCLKIQDSYSETNFINIVSAVLFRLGSLKLENYFFSMI